MRCVVFVLLLTVVTRPQKFRLAFSLSIAHSFLYILLANEIAVLNDTLFHLQYEHDTTKYSIKFSIETEREVFIATRIFHPQHILIFIAHCACLYGIPLHRETDFLFSPLSSLHYTTAYKILLSRTTDGWEKSIVFWCNWWNLYLKIKDTRRHFRTKSAFLLKTKRCPLKLWSTFFGPPKYGQMKSGHYQNTNNSKLSPAVRMHRNPDFDLPYFDVELNKTSENFGLLM